MAAGVTDHSAWQLHDAAGAKWRRVGRRAAVRVWWTGAVFWKRQPPGVPGCVIFTKPLAYVPDSSLTRMLSVFSGRERRASFHKEVLRL